MRIVQILPAMDGGEVALTALDFAQELVRQGHESLVISAGGELVSRLTLHGSRHETIKIDGSVFGGARRRARLRALLQEIAPDILHARGPAAARLAAAVCRGMAVASRPHLVTSIHDVADKSGFRARAAIKPLLQGERVIAPSAAMAGYLQQHFPEAFSAQAPEVIYRGVNTRELDGGAPVSGHWHQRILNSFPQLEGKHWLLLPAEVAPGRGQQRFLEVLAGISLQRDDVFGLIVGDVRPGSEKFARALEQQAERMGLSEKVLFLGGRRDMRELYASARITFSLADSNYGNGREVSESLAMACPVVVPAGRGAGAEMAAHCFPQGVVAVDDVDALVSSSLEILQGARPVCFDGFSLRETTARAVAVYTALCGDVGNAVSKASDTVREEPVSG